MPGAPSHSLFQTARTFWREFFAAWLFPLVFLFGGVASERVGHPVLFFWLVAMPLFFWAFARASRPWLRKQVKYWHAVVLGMLLPFAVFAVAVYLRLLIIHGQGS
jgi:uncharacterized Tic20 family protein